MRHFLILAVILAFATCSKESATYYEYNGATITRIDRGNKIYFYYGRFDNENFPETFVKAEYSGFNSGIHAYMIFFPNGRVRISPAGGLFKKNGADSLLSLYEFNDNYLLNAWLDSIRGNFNNTVELSDGLKFEEEINRESHSKVKVSYP